MEVINRGLKLSEATVYKEDLVFAWLGPQGALPVTPYSTNGQQRTHLGQAFVSKAG